MVDTFAIHGTRFDCCIQTGAVNINRLPTEREGRTNGEYWPEVVAVPIVTNQGTTLTATTVFITNSRFTTLSLYSPN